MNDDKKGNADIIEEGVKLIDTYVRKKWEACQANCLLRGKWRGREILYPYKMDIVNHPEALGH